MSRRPLVVGLVLLSLLALVATGWWILSRQEALPANPRGLVPITTDLYTEVPSVPALRAALRELGGYSGLPLGIESVTQSLPRAAQDALADPTRHGLDDSRAVGVAARLSGNTPLIVAFLPVRDADAFAAATGTSRSALDGLEPAATNGAFVLLRRGYALIADRSEAVADLVTLDTAPLPVPDPPPGTLMSAFVSAGALAAARAYGDAMSGLLPSSARLGASALGALLQTLDGVQVNLTTTDGDYGVRVRLLLAEGSGFLEAFDGAAGAPTLGMHLPPAGLVVGGRVNPAGMRQAAERMLDRLAADGGDSVIIAIARSGLDAISPEMAGAILSWEARDPGGARSVVLQVVPPGDADDFLRRLAGVRDAGLTSMTRMMQSAGLENATQRTEPVTSIRDGDVTLEGLSVTTTLGMEPPPGADAQVRAMFDRMNVQRVVQRYGRVRAGDRDLYLTVTGEDSGAAVEAIRWARAPGDPGEARRRALSAIGDRVVAWAVFEPERMRGPAPGGEGSTSEAATLAVRLEGRTLDLDLRTPKEALQLLLQ